MKTEGRVKVLYYNHTSQVSGAEICLLSYIAAIQPYVDVALVAPHGDIHRYASSLGVETYILKPFEPRMTRNPLRLVVALLHILLLGRDLRMLVDQVRPDVVHANSIRAGLICSLSLGRKTRVVWHIHDMLPHNVVGKVVRLVAAWRSSYIVAISNAVRNNFSNSKRLWAKTSIVYNGVDMENNEANDIRHECGTSEDTFVVAVVGQIAPWKRQLDAVRAFSLVSQRIENCEMWVVGEPKFRAENYNYAHEVKKLVQSLNLGDRVRFLGFREDIKNVMKSIDVLLVPSENEPFGRVIIEGLSQGRPVVGTNSGGIPEMIVHGVNGFLVPVGDIDAIAEQLITMFGYDTPKQLRSNYEDRCTEHVRLHFTVQRAIIILLGLYRAY